LLVRIAGLTLGRGDEARAELHRGVADTQLPSELLRVADAARRDNGEPEGREFIEQRLGREPPRVAAGELVHRDEAIDAAVDALLRPLPLGDVVVHDAA